MTDLTNIFFFFFLMKTKIFTQAVHEHGKLAVCTIFIIISCNIVNVRDVLYGNNSFLSFSLHVKCKKMSKFESPNKVKCQVHLTVNFPQME